MGSRYVDNQTSTEPYDSPTSTNCDKYYPNWLCYIFLFFTTVPAVENIFVVATIWRGSPTTLSASSYVFLASLAVADCVVGLAGIVLSVIYLLVYPEDSHMYPASNAFSVITIVYQTLMYISIVHMAVLAFDRYLYIVHPYVYERIVTRRLIIVTIAGTWLLGIFTTLLPSIYYVFHPWGAFCEVIDIYPVFTISMGSAYLVTLTITCLAYFKIFQEARRKARCLAVLPTSQSRISNTKRKISSRVSPENRNFQDVDPSTSRVSNSRANIAHGEDKTRSTSVPGHSNWKSSMKIVKFLFLVFGISVACTLPSVLCLLLNSVVPVQRDTAFVLTIGLPFNSGANFIIVVISDKSFRKQLKKLIKDLANHICLKH